MYKAVIFDFDGVIVNTEPLHHHATLAALKPFNIEFDYPYFLKHYVGVCDQDMFSHIAEHNNLTSTNESIDTLVATKTSHYHQRITELNPIDGVVGFVEHIKQLGLPIAISSNGQRKEILLILNSLEQGALQQHFSHVVSVNDVKAGKPEPYGYLLAAEKLGVAPNECLAIEDTPVGIRAAKAAGMTVVGVTNTYSADRLTEANYIVSNLKDVLKLLDM